MSGSVSFDQAAEYYDRTRVTGEAALAATLDLLEGQFRGRGRVLEVGVGTGAIALPLAQRGLSLAGLDLSAPMMRKLVEKAGGRTFPLTQGDATRIPFRDGAFDGAYVRWVLHLISGWREAVAELCRVVGSGGSVIVEPGGYGGRWRDVWRRFVAEVGEAAAPVGLDVRHGYSDLDEAFARGRAHLRELPVIMMPIEGSLSEFFQEAGDRIYSWTWNVPDGQFREALGRVRDWAAEEYGDLDKPYEEQVPMAWRAYDVS